MRCECRFEASRCLRQGPLTATIENLSSSGALLVTSHAVEQPLVERVDVELKLGLESGWLSARTVRVETHRSTVADRGRVRSRWSRRSATSIEAAIEGAIAAAARRPVLVVDDHTDRRADLIARLAARGMTPLAPRTPLEAVDLLTRSHLHINVALLAPELRSEPLDDLRALFAESFPWVTADRDLERRRSDRRCRGRARGPTHRCRRALATRDRLDRSRRSYRPEALRASHAYMVPCSR